MERPNQVLKLINAHITTTTTVMTQHDFLREIYNDFCIKNDMPKHIKSENLSRDIMSGYLSAGDIKYASKEWYSFTKYQKDWLNAFLVLWETVEEQSCMERMR